MNNEGTQFVESAPVSPMQVDIERPVLTVHGPLDHGVLDRVLTALEGALDRSGARNLIVTDEGPNLVVWASLPSSF